MVGSDKVFGSRVDVRPDEGDDALEVEFAEIGIHFGDLGFEFGSVAFAEATHDDELAQLVFFLAFRHLEDHVDALFFGIADESAGIDDADLAFWFFGVMHAGPPASFELSHNALGID